ncbi:hypothetical protein E4T50_04685 [Aureobasidium sp. EXF-12298]|nr:hypothetical protein E4T50_04685 [Aureobasidium sp. EXF-12298]KAI4764218.1 hypothetical protein E4T51_02776 [Aureobasidium sp. EXF-12344]KAI4781326.1 hypothetical protein E4T52_03774 [Aureobasidium sp. EXF-3400]
MPPTRSTRSTRAGTSRLTAPTSTSAIINRQTSDPHHLRITVKAPPSKLRQAISGDDPESDYPDADDSPEPPVRTARSTRNPRTVLDNESDDDQEEDDDEDDDDDAEGEDDDVENTEMMDAEGSDEDADADADDMDMDSPHPTAPVIRVLPAVSAASSKPKANIAVSAPPHKGNLKSVEAKELDDDDEDDDDELSDLQSGDEDLPGAEDDDEELDSDLEGEDGDTTLDLTKLTRRQRAVYDEEQDESLMALSNEAQKKKHLTAEEHAMRRAEMARRRKNLSEKRNEEEKMDTINKLLKKPATKRRTRAEIIAAQNAAEATPAYTEDGEEYFHPASSLFVRYVNNKDGSRIGVPSEWLEEGQPVGQVLRNGWKAPPKMVEEVS